MKMKVSQRGRVTIPKKLRQLPGVEPHKLNLAKWKGRCCDCFRELGYTSVDKFIEDVRGR